MELSEIELKELWSRSDEYFQFSFDEYKSFGSRLKKWRELNHLTQRDVALSLYKSREALHLPLSTTDSLIKTYGKWENKNVDFDTIFSIDNLRILKNLLNVDYDFLLCECDTPHKATKDIAKQIGLSTKSIEKLSCMDKRYNGDNTSPSARYSYALLSSFDTILSDDDLLCYLSYFLTHLSYEENVDDTDFNTISVLKPINGSSDKDSILDGESIDIDVPGQLDIFTTTIATKLCNLRDNKSISVENIPILPDNESRSADIGHTFGERLQYLRKQKRLTQNEVADLLIDNRKYFDLPVIDKMSVLRTYQNWEKKTTPDKEVRLSLQDLKILQRSFDCSFDYLLNESDKYYNFTPTPQEITGLSKASIEKLSRYASSLYNHDDKIPAYASQILSALDLILSDNELLSDLTYFLSDLPYYPRLNFCTILKPIDFEINSPSDIAYKNTLFNDTELRNVFLPDISKHLLSLRERQHYNHHPLN